MTKNDFVDLLKEDLKNEYKHMLFYLNAGVNIQGPHRAEIGEFLLKEAREELDHVEEFCRLIIDLDGVADYDKLDYPTTNLTDVALILEEIFRMETEVVERYVQRIKDAESSLNDVDAKYVSVFLEDQVLHSRQAAADVNQMLKGI